MYEIFHIYQIKNVYTKHIENIPNFGVYLNQLATPFHSGVILSKIV